MTFCMTIPLNSHLSLDGNEIDDIYVSYCNPKAIIFKYVTQLTPVINSSHFN